MARALELARRGRGAVEPNPMVGAVIVREGQVIGEGWHRKFGGPHAEVEAIEAARRAGEDTAGGTMYVTLEPCCHQGKTPPCAEAIKAAGIARVVAAMADPDRNVAGGGLEALRAGGIEVTCGVCGETAGELLAAYVKLRTTGRPWVICKWAQWRDGPITAPPGESRWISGDQSRARVHRLRSLCDGICVGVGTAVADDPLLTNRSGSGDQPVRVVLDSRGRIPLDSQLLTTAGQSPVIVATGPDAPDAAVEAIAATAAEVIKLPAGAGGVALPALLDELGRRRWTNLLIEGGAKVHHSFISQGLADELLVFVAPREIGGGEHAWRGLASVAEIVSLPEPQIEQVGADVLKRYVLNRPAHSEQANQ